MANTHTTLTGLFTDIADAIRAKTGGTESIVADAFPEAIRNVNNEDAFLTRTIKFYNDSEITSIGDYAFYGCSSLSTVNLPNVITIGSSAFRYCTALGAIELPKAESIGSLAFAGCTSLSSVSLYGSTIISIGINIFYSTPIANSSFTGAFGSIYVPTSLVASYQVATNWSQYSERFVGV